MHLQITNQFQDRLPAEVCHASEGMDFLTAFHCCSAWRKQDSKMLLSYSNIEVLYNENNERQISNQKGNSRKEDKLSDYAV